MKRLALVLALGVTAALVPVAEAVVPPGPNGKIVFTSGRGGMAGDDSNAKIWMVQSDLGGTATQVTTGTTRHSHPAWSPDRTRVAYSHSLSGAGSRDIFVLDLASGDEINLTNTATEDEDRAAWSPDGTKIAYSQAANDTAGMPRDIFIRPSLGGTQTNFAINGVATEDKPVWSPDGLFIYYAIDTVPATDSDIVKRHADGSDSNPTGVITDPAANDYQPNISHDGSKLCFSRGGMGDSGPTGVDVYTPSALGLNQNVQGFATSTTQGEFNCVFSPDDKRILHVRGVFSGGALVVRDFPAAGTTDVVSDVASHFDGNPDWAVNPSPSCQSRTVAVDRNGIVEIPLTCTDPEGQSVSREIATPPGRGVLSSITSGDTVFYTPNLNVSGADQFTFTGSDGTSNAAPATIGLNVRAQQPPPRARPAIGGLALSRKKWRRGSALPKISRTGKGTKISFTLSEPARTTLTFARRGVGRTVGGRCRKRTRANRNRNHCTRYVRAGALPSFQARQGGNTVAFAGRISSRKRLPLGRYKLTVSARDADGDAAVPRSASFRIVAR